MRIVKKIIFIFLTISLLTGGCAGMASKTKSLSDDMGSPQKIALLRERATEFWTAFVKEDYEKIFNMQDPFFRAKKDIHAYISTLGRIKYHKFEIKDIKVEGNIAKVEMSLVYSVPSYKFKKVSFTVPETEQEIETTWIYVYDNWYKEWRSEMVESGAAEY